MLMVRNEEYMKKLNNPHLLALLLIIVVGLQVLAFWYLVWGKG